MAIRFYKTNEEYGDFSNFAKYEIVLLGMTWKTSEHYFQARKFKDANVFMKVMDAETPLEAARIGRDRNNKIREDWESIKLEVMREAVYAKFTQHDSLRKLLLSTENQEIIEASPHDSFWGEGKDQKGKNYLGKILVETRDKIRAEPPEDVIIPWEYNSEAEPSEFFWSQGQAEKVVADWLVFLNSLSDEARKSYLKSLNIPEVWSQLIK